MALRNIVKEGDPILLKECRVVEKFDDKLHQLLDDMLETMNAANGAGLAAPQVGILRRICIVQADPEAQVVELINPTILETEGEQSGLEGCLSFPGEYGMVTRPMKVKVKAQDRSGKWFEAEGEGLKARAFCHEIDHLHGVLFKRLATRMLTKEELKAALENQEKDD